MPSSPTCIRITDAIFPACGTPSPALFMLVWTIQMLLRFGRVPGNNPAPKQKRLRSFWRRFFRVGKILLKVIARGAFEEGAELARTRRVAQLAQRLGFDPANAFASDGERLADFFERMLAAVV